MFTVKGLGFRDQGFRGRGSFWSPQKRLIFVPPTRTATDFGPDGPDIGPDGPDIGPDDPDFGPHLWPCPAHIQGQDPWPPGDILGEKRRQKT